MLEPILEKIISKEGERESKIKFSFLALLETFCILLPQARLIFIVQPKMKAINTVKCSREIFGLVLNCLDKYQHYMFSLLDVQQI